MFVNKLECLFLANFFVLVEAPVAQQWQHSPHYSKVQGSSPPLRLEDIKMAKSVSCSNGVPYGGRHNIHHNDIKHNDTQHNRLICDTQHKWYSPYYNWVPFILSVVLLSVAIISMLCWGSLCWMSLYSVSWCPMVALYLPLLANIRINRRKCRRQTL